MSSRGGEKVIHPVVVIEVNGVKCRALIDTGASSSYASAQLVDTLKIKPYEVKYKKVEMLVSTLTARMETYKTTIASTSSAYKLEVDFIKVEKGKLLEVENPKYEQIIGAYPHLTGVKMDDMDTKSELPIHAILGAGVYAEIKLATQNWQPRGTSGRKNEVGVDNPFSWRRGGYRTHAADTDKSNGLRTVMPIGCTGTG